MATHINTNTWKMDWKTSYLKLYLPSENEKSDHDFHVISLMVFNIGGRIVKVTQTSKILHEQS